MEKSTNLNLNAAFAIRKGHHLIPSFNKVGQIGKWFDLINWFDLNIENNFLGRCEENRNSVGQIKDEEQDLNHITDSV